MLLPYKQMCAQRQAQGETVIIESDNIADALSKEITRCGIGKLVIGASSHGAFTRKTKAGRLSSKISASAPSFCTVYVISKGKLSSVRASTSGLEGNTEDGMSNSTIDSRSFSSEASWLASEWTETDADSSSAGHHQSCSPLALQRHQVLKVLNQNLQRRPDYVDVSEHSSTCTLRLRSTDLPKTASRVQGEEEIGSSSLGLRDTGLLSISGRKVSLMEKQESPATPATEHSSSDEVDVAFELEKLRLELRHVQVMRETAQNETSDASRQLKELSLRRVQESQRLQEISSREERARVLVKKMKDKRKEAEKEAAVTRERAKMEFHARKEAEEEDGARVAEEMQGLKMAASASLQQRYRAFEWADIISATSSLAHDRMLGGGANGTVYKGNLHHTKVAVKVLHSNEIHRTQQFRQELEVLGRIRHPHLLLLLGACPDYGCLVYEYMENGSLDDRLQRKNGEPPLRWFDRFRIAWEIASALVFLHNAKPKPIVHRDLKPANILLDHNLVSKIGDVGLSTLLPATNASTSAAYKHTTPVGTLCYIDPEYQRTGILTLESDVYALGLVILQLLTAKPPMGLAHVVETAIEDGHLADVLDLGAGDWPLEETLELADVGLRCAELRRRDRPNLQGYVLPMLERLMSFSDDARNSLYQRVPSLPPSHFICPILQEVMDEPCVAADGYTYDRRAMVIWLSLNDKSPLTNLPLPNKVLISNHALLSAIEDWKSTRILQQYGWDQEE